MADCVFRERRLSLPRLVSRLRCIQHAHLPRHRSEQQCLWYRARFYLFLRFPGNRHQPQHGHGVRCHHGGNGRGGTGWHEQQRHGNRHHQRQRKPLLGHACDYRCHRGEYLGLYAFCRKCGELDGEPARRYFNRCFNLQWHDFNRGFAADSEQRRQRGQQRDSGRHGHAKQRKRRERKSFQPDQPDAEQHQLYRYWRIGNGHRRQSAINRFH